MKNKVWLLHLPIIIAFTTLFIVAELVNQGKLSSQFFTQKLFPIASFFSGVATDAKFWLRGTIQPKNRIVIVEIDNDSLSDGALGRWPWRRDRTARLIQNTFDSGAKFVGLDITFSEENRQISDELRTFFQEHNLGGDLNRFETDPKLKETIAKYKDRLALGWIPDGVCVPAYSSPEECPVHDPTITQLYAKQMSKFSIKNHSYETGVIFNTQKTPILTSTAPIINIEEFSNVAHHLGALGTQNDRDGVIRRTPLVFFGGGEAYPVIGLTLAQMALGESVEYSTDKSYRMKQIAFSKSKRTIPTNHLGVMEINFRGPGNTFEYVSAAGVYHLSEKVKVRFSVGTGSYAEEERPRTEALRDAIVIIGLSALGVNDIRAFPFDSKVPGVEGHATILDNLLAGDMLSRGPSWVLWVMLTLMTLGAGIFGIAFAHLEALPSLALLLGTFATFGLIDVKLLFSNHFNINSVFLFSELLSIAVITFAAKYLIEEKNKKFIRGAFAKYVAPAIVDSILKDPSKLTVGGDRKELTILFSDIRGFTTFSERLDAKKLAQFLNDYLGIMTDLVFDNEGTLDKYIGDAVMAFWGAPLDQPTHALNACKAAIRMQQVLDQNRKRFLEQYGVEVYIGIGINSGIVNVGNMGSERIFEYTVIGDHVNLASRLEGLTKYYGAGIVTTRFTFDCIVSAGQTPPPHRILDSVKVKGKKTAVELIEVLTRELPQAGLEAFAQGRALYAKRLWVEAIHSFQKANDLLRPSTEEVDGPSQMFIERCNGLKDSPPDADWDGSWEMHSK